MRRGPGRLFVGRLALGVLGLLVPLLLVELALQAGALVAWWRNAPLAAARALEHDVSAPAILCVGDSYTFGIGARSPDESWPRALERRLAHRRPAPRVVNLGWPSCNSAEILATVRRELPRTKPAIVAILAGANDRWSRPDRVPAAPRAADDAGFVWRLRTPRLLALCLQPRDAAPPGATPAFAAERHPLVGRWQDESRALLALRPDGVARLGPVSLRWREEAGRLRFTDPDGASWTARFSVDGDSLRLEPDAGGALRFTRVVAAPHASGPASFGRRLGVLRPGDDSTEAWTIVEQWLAAEPDSIEARVASVGLAVRGDRRHVVAESLDWLRRRHAEAGDEPSARALVQALDAAGLHGEALALARAEAERFPESGRIWLALGLLSALADDAATAEAALDRAIELLPGVPAAERAEIRFQRALAVAKRDRVEAARDVVRSFRIDPDPRRVRRAATPGGVELSSAELEAAAAELGLDDAARRDLLAAHQATSRTDDELVSVLADHLAAMVRCCREAGATPFLVTYPFRAPFVDEARALAIEREPAPVIDVVPRFDELLRSVPRAELFVGDGHCTGRGYAELAGVVAVALERSGVLR